MATSLAPAACARLPLRSVAPAARTQQRSACAAAGPAAGALRAAAPYRCRLLWSQFRSQAAPLPSARSAQRLAGRREAAARPCASAAATPPPPADEHHLRVVAEKVARAARVMASLSWLGFWVQLVLSVVSAVIIVFSILFKGVTKGTDAGLYFVLFGLVASFLSVFWSMGYSRLAKKLRAGAEQPEQAPARQQVLQSLSSGVTINMVGMGATVVGLQATTGLLFAKTLSVAAQNPYLTAGAFNPVLALDIFLVQAAANTLLSHFVGAAASLWMLRAISD